MKTYVLACAILLAGAGSFYYFSSANVDPVAAHTGTTATMSKDMPKIAVVTSDFKVGHFFSLRDIKWVPADQVKAASGAQTFSNKDQLEDYVGAIINRDMAAGQALLAGDLTKSDTPDFMAAVLNPGMRAFAIQVDNVTGGAGLLRPGNRVDVILAAELPAGDDPADFRRRPIRTAKTLLTNLRVIAVNKNLEPHGFQKAGNKDSKGFAPSRRTDKGTVTLEVTPHDVEVLTVARTVGELSLSLCDLHTSDAPAPARRLTTVTDILPSNAKTPQAVKPGTTPVKTFYGNTSHQ